MSARSQISRILSCREPHSPVLRVGLGFSSLRVPHPLGLSFEGSVLRVRFFSRVSLLRRLAQASLARFRAPNLCSLIPALFPVPQIPIRLIQPILPRRRKHIQIQRIFHRPGLMRHVRRNTQNLSHDLYGQRETVHSAGGGCRYLVLWATVDLLLEAQPICRAFVSDLMCR